MRADALDATLAKVDGPDHRLRAGRQRQHRRKRPLGAIVASAHARGAWVHVDGAFGFWAAAGPELRARSRVSTSADSWATDAHKWLNVPYDSGLAIVADPAPHRAAMSIKASYLQRGADEERSGMDWVPESSRRSRALPLYALIPFAWRRRHRGDRAPQLRAGAAHGQSAVEGTRHHDPQ